MRTTTTARERKSLATVAARAWSRSRTTAADTWDREAAGGLDLPELDQYTTPWQDRLVRFAIQFNRECKAAGIDPDARPSTGAR